MRKGCRPSGRFVIVFVLWRRREGAAFDGADQGRLAQGEGRPASLEFINAAGLEMKSVDEHIESIGARAEHCESQGWARSDVMKRGASSGPV